jgi:ankyrin repeat protein
MNANQKELNYRIIKFLLEKGADIQQKTLKDQTALHLL